MTMRLTLHPEDETSTKWIEYGHHLFSDIYIKLYIGGYRLKYADKKQTKQANVGQFESK